MHRRIIGLLTLLVYGLGLTAQPIYFDGLYNFDDRVEGIAIGGSQMVPGGYVHWNYGRPSGEQNSQVSLFKTDFSGEVLDIFDFPLIDTIKENSQNLIVLNDSEYVALSMEQNLTEEEPGDLLLRKIGADGSEIWNNRYGQQNRLDIPQRVIQTEDGGFAIVGQVVNMIGEDDDGQAMLYKTDSSGNEVWSNQFGGSLYDAGISLVQTADLGFLILGWTRSFGNGEKDWYLIKTDSLGNQQWQETYGDNNNQSGSTIIPFVDEDYVMCGGGGGGNARMIRVSDDGNVVWMENYTHPEGTGSNYLFSCVALSDSTIVGCGLTNDGNDAGWLVKTDADGNVLWQRKYIKNQFPSLFYSVIESNDGGFLLSGQAINDTTFSQDAWLLKVDSVGCTYPHCTVGINDLEPTEVVVDVWPNPASDVVKLQVQSSRFKSGRVSVTDAVGRVYANNQLSTLYTEIDIGTWPDGLYLLTIVQDDKRSTVRVVVQH